MVTERGRIARLEGAYEQMDKRLSEFHDSILDLRYPHRTPERDVARMVNSLRAELIAMIDATNRRVDETNRRLDSLKSK